MNKNKFFIALRFCTAFFALCALFAGCSNSVFNGDIPTTLPKDPNATDKPVAGSTAAGKDSSSFIRGFDASYVGYYEDECSWFSGYLGSDGDKKDIFGILANYGVNTIRLRLWVDPKNAVTNGIKTDFDDAQGGNDLTRTIKLAKRAKNAGLNVMLDFHYSDVWADPGKQVIPFSWQTIGTVDEMAEKVKSYTTEVLEAMKEARCLPDMVQVGNEIDNGILLHDKAGSDERGTNPTSTPLSTVANSANSLTYLAAGCEAVRECDEKIKIILHVTNRSGYATALMNKMKSKEDLYDIVGLSYYPWESHGTPDDLQKNIADIKDAGKEAMVVETSMIWANDPPDAKVTAGLKRTHDQMLDPETGNLYEDLEEYVSGSTFAPSVSLQEKVLKHVFEATYSAGGLGVCVWGADQPGDWKYALFDGDGKPMDGMSVFSMEFDGEGGGGTEDETPKESETMTMTVNFVGFTLSSTDKVTVHYGHDKSGKSYKDVDAVISNDGTSASATLEKKYGNDWGFNGVTVKVIKDGAQINPVMNEDSYFAFEKDSTVVRTLELITDEFIPIVTDKSVTLPGKAWNKEDVLSTADVAALSTATKVKITVTDASSKVCCYGGSTWVADLESSNSYSAIVSKSDDIKDLYWYGLKIDSGMTSKTVKVSVSYLDGGTKFPDPPAAPTYPTSVSVAGNFNSWSTTGNPLTHNGSGVYTGTVTTTAANQEYKIVVNGTDWYGGGNDLSTSGGNLTFTAAGTYTITVDCTGSTYKLTVTGGGSTPIIYNFGDTISYAADGNLKEIVSKESFSGLSPTTIKIEVTGITGSETWYFEYGMSPTTGWAKSHELSWDSGISGHSISITDSSDISEILSSGLYLKGTNGLTANVKVTLTP